MPSRSERVYSVLLYAYPRTFRARSGREMQEAFRDCLRQQAVDVAGFTRLWARTVIDVLVSAVPEHFASIRRRMRRPARSWSTTAVYSASVVDPSHGQAATPS